MSPQEHKDNPVPPTRVVLGLEWPERQSFSRWLYLHGHSVSFTADGPSTFNGEELRGHPEAVRVSKQLFDQFVEGTPELCKHAYIRASGPDANSVHDVFIP